MKNSIYISLVLVVLLAVRFNSFAQKGNVRAYMDYKQFYDETIGNYVEVYFQILGSSVHYKETGAGLQAELGVGLSLAKGDSILEQSNFRMLSPLMKDSIVDDFYELKRYAVQPGTYELSIKLFDLNSSQDAIQGKQKLIVKDLSKEILFSDPLAIEYAHHGNDSSIFYKAGYEIIPRLVNFYPNELSAIPMYLEVYHTNQLKDSVIAIKQWILDTKNNQEVAGHTSISKKRTSPVLSILRTIPMDELPTGDYALCFSVLDRNLIELATTRYAFQRNNDKVEEYDPALVTLDPAFQASITEDSISFYLESLIPIAKPAEVKNIIKTLKMKDPEAARKHIQGFWIKSAPNSVFDSWIQYKAQVLLVQRIYSNNFQNGYETDRGRVYLQYGAPTNIISRENSPTEYPYEIWQYNKIGKFSNKRFIFYNPDLTNNTYRLLHSDMIGELKNQSWQLQLNKRNTTNGNIDDPNKDLQQHYGGEGYDLFRQY